MAYGDGDSDEIMSEELKERILSVMRKLVRTKREEWGSLLPRWYEWLLESASRKETAVSVGE